MIKFYYRTSIFLTGVVIGLLLGKLCTDIQKTVHSNRTATPSYQGWFLSNKYRKHNVIWDTLRYNKSFHPVIEADLLYKKIPIVCLILLSNPNNEKPILQSWSKGCNEVKMIRITKRKTIRLKRIGNESTWYHLCEALQNVENFHWSLIVSDYTFVIMENLRYFVAAYNSSQQLYLGHAIKFWGTHYNSKTGGIILSKGVTVAFKNIQCLDNQYQNKEDYYLGKTLKSLGIVPIDTNDEAGLSRFHPFSLNSLIFGTGRDKITNVFPYKCCSQYSISFRAIDGTKMYTYYYLLYTVQLFIHGTLGNVPNSQQDDDKVWKDFLRDRNVFNDNITSLEYWKLWEKLIDDPTSFAANIKRETDDEGF